MNRIKIFLTARKNFIDIFVNIIIGIIGLLGLILFVPEVISTNSTNNVNIVSEEEINEIHPSKEIMFVDIQGEVNKPGVYQFSFGDKIIDAINYAGGLTNNYDDKYLANCINLAEKLKDQQKIIVPAKNTQKVCNNNLYTSGYNSKISINNSSLSDIDKLPGIGPSTAQKIIDARPFKSLDDVKNVSGIGDSTYEKIKDLIEL